MNKKLSFLGTVFLILLINGCSSKKEVTTSNINKEIQTAIENNNSNELLLETELNLKTNNNDEVITDIIKSNDINESIVSQEVQEAEESFVETETPTMPEIQKDLINSKPVSIVPPKSVIVNFGIKSYAINNIDDIQLQEIAKFLNANENYSANIFGYTDNKGASKYNLYLSQQRANFIKEYLLSFKVNPNQLNAKGLGATNFIATNDTKDGRATNRRVEITIISIENGK